MPVKPLVAFVARLSGRERALVYAAAAVVGIFVLDRLVIGPLAARVIRLDGMVRHGEEQVRQSLTVAAYEQKIRGERKRYAGYLSRPAPEEEEVTAFLKDVEDFALKSLVNLVDVKPAGIREDGPAKKYFVKLRFEAQMEQVFHFFHQAAGVERLITVEGYQINPKSEGTSVVMCSALMSKTVIPE